MNHTFKSLVIILIVLMVIFPLAACESRPFSTTLSNPNDDSSSASLSAKTVLGNCALFINYNSKIYQNTTEVQQSQIERKINDEIHNKDYYKIQNVDTEKAIAIKNKNNSFNKYEYLFNESFSWKNKKYRINYSFFALLDGYSQGSEKCKLGKSLGKTDNLEIFENAVNNSNDTILVRPDGVNAPTKEAYFLAVAQ